MKESKKSIKENNIIEAAERVFDAVGFKNAKMEDIASEAGITKVTLYSYFQSKENLYLAITYRALQTLNERYYSCLDRNKNAKGVDSVIALIETFMSFCEDNFLYSETLLDYFSMVRSTSSGQDKSKLTEATKESIYYLKLQDIQNLPFKLTAKEIQRGQEDGSILSNIDPIFSTLQGWSFIIGYTKVLNANGSNQSPLFNVNLNDLKRFNLKLARALLSNEVVANELENVDLLV
ncbi:MAG: TetR/AcrR family transcriptional regulator [Saprospiraceae bacterium]|nr:TetR/AcrR family transcriptional regulator [Saprospiraceae bacterium]